MYISTFDREFLVLLSRCLLYNYCKRSSALMFLVIVKGFLNASFCFLMSEKRVKQHEIKRYATHIRLL